MSGAYITVVNRLVEQYRKDYGIGITEGEVEEAKAFYEAEITKALGSYPQGVKVLHCPKCGSPLVFQSMDYFEGFHMDTCI